MWEKEDPQKEDFVFRVLLLSCLGFVSLCPFWKDVCPLTNANRKKRCFLAVSKGTNAHERGDDDQNDDQNDDDQNDDDDFFDQKRRLYRKREKKIGKDYERTETPTPTFSSL